MKNVIIILVSVAALSAFPGMAEPEVKAAVEEAKAFYHVMLFKWKADISDNQIAEIGTLWTEMEAKIPGFESFEMNVLEPGSFHAVVILKFSSVEAYSVYLAHEDHEKIKFMASPWVAGFSEFDYWK